MNRRRLKVANEANSATELYAPSGRGDLLEERFVRRIDAARMLGVSASTLTRWAKKGLVPAITTIGGHHRYLLSDIQSLRARMTVDGDPDSLPRESSTEDLQDPEYSTTAVAVDVDTSRFSAGAGTDLVEVRWHGRGGQGAVTAAELLAESALEEGKYFQAFPEFGAERTGAPIRAYTRLGSSPINLHCPILQPDIVVVLDPTLLTSVDVFEGLDDGIALVNTPLAPARIAPDTAGRKWRVCTVDATGIVLETLGRNIPNTAMIGALLKVSPVVDKGTCRWVMVERLSARFSSRVVQANVDAFERAYADVRVEI